MCPLFSCKNNRAGILLARLARFLLLAVVLWGFWYASTFAAPAAEQALQPAPQLLGAGFGYMGAASCSASACHGSITPRHTFESAQNEHFIWAEKDPHARAYDSLTTPDAKIMGRHLNIAAPEKSDRCLTCHSLTVPPNLQSKLYDKRDGVSCEACHGPAERWLGPHTRRDWNAKNAATLGMVNTKDIALRAKQCMGCHAGEAEKTVTHELIASGHPRLKFELDNYTYAMPPHWRTSEEPHDRGIRVWAIGQATALQNEVQLLRSSWQTRGAFWPDFSRLDCFACHRPIVDHSRDLTEEEKTQQRWRVRAYDGRKPGGVVWNTSRDSAFQSLVTQLSAEDGQALDQLVRVIHRGLSDPAMTADVFDAAMTELTQLSDRLVSQVSSYQFTPSDSLTLMKGITAESLAPSSAGFLEAEQAVLAIASLYDAYTDAAGPPPEAEAIAAILDVLFEHIDDSGHFNPVRFEAGMKKLHNHFRKIEYSGKTVPSSS